MSQVSIQSAFNEVGLKNSVSQSIEHVKKLYLSDSIPWVIGYSGGKDSTATLQLVWYALQELAISGIRSSLMIRCARLSTGSCPSSKLNIFFSLFKGHITI